MYVRAKKQHGFTYLQLVESKRIDGQPRQQVLANLGRLDQLLESGAYDRLLISMQRFSDKLAVLGATEGHAASVESFTLIGAPLIFERLWRELGIGDVLRRLLGKRKFSFEVERAIFITVLHRLMASGSDRQAERWMSDYRIEGAEALSLHHFYRAMAWLGETLPEEEQADATPFSPRVTKDLIEEQLFERRRTLFTGLDLVFFDTTSIYFEGEGGATLGQYGYSKDHRPDLKQMVVGVILDGEGNAVCSELWPGNTTDVTTLQPVAERLKKRFQIGRICVVADRGMISEKTRAALTKLKWQYILGVRMRVQKVVREEVLSQDAGYEEVVPERKAKNDPSPLKVREVRLDEGRYIVCLNEEEARKDRHDREAIVTSLREALKAGDKSLVGNKGYRRYLKNPEAHFAIDEQKVAEDARYDGKWVLVTNTELPAAEVALKYKQLWTVEEIFRSMKTLLETRPVFHKRDETIRGHVWCSFLALLLRKELQARLARHSKEGNESAEWANVVRDLDLLGETDVAVGGKTYRLRTPAKGTVAGTFAACGVALPPTIRQIQ
jgi:hypothetical protein